MLQIASAISMKQQNILQLVLLFSLKFAAWQQKIKQKNLPL